MLGRISVFLFCVSLVVGQQTPALKGWLLGWATDPNLPLLKHGNKSYYLGINYKASFLQAMQFCDIVYMKLLTIESDEENNFIKKLVVDASQGAEYWTSGSKILDGRNWVWMSDGKAIDYTNWAPPEPNSRSEKCLQVVNTNDGLMWNDLDCTKRINFICQRENGDQPTVLQNHKKDSFSVSPNINILKANGKSYYFTRDFRGDFFEAAFFCRALHMTLATINSEEENLAIEKYIRDTNFGDKWWAAGTRFLDNVWTWFTNGQHIEYTRWQRGQPDNWRNKEQCLSLWYDHEGGLLWNDFSCYEKLNFICEKKESYTHQVSKREASKDIFSEISDEQWMKEVKETPSGLISVSLYAGNKFHVETQMQGNQKQASLFCEYHDLQLVSVDKEQKNYIIKKILLDIGDNGLFWTSGRKVNGKWKWGTNKAFNFTNRKFVKTSQLSNACLEISNNGEWYQAPCNYHRSFICEQKEKHETEPEREPEPEPTLTHKKCSVQPIVNVYINNNLVTEGAEAVLGLEKEKIEGDYTVDVTNKLSSCSTN